MKVTHRRGSRTCSACEETDTEGFVVVMGGLVFSLCEKCLRRLSRRTGREIKKIDDEKEKKEREERSLAKAA